MGACLEIRIDIPGSRPCSDHSVILFHVVPGSISWRTCKIVNWFASRQLDS